MPVANCFLKNPESVGNHLTELVMDWANHSKVNPDDITLNLIKVHKQAGHAYQIMVNLYLPTLWKPKDIERIQSGLLKTLSKNLSVKKEHIFIMTSLIQSSHVIDQGEIVKWE